jgi:hypothetical protein
MARGILAVLLVLTITGCGTIYYEAPEGSEVEMLDRHAPAQVRVERTVWYWLWGRYALSDDSAESAIRENGLRQVRFSTKQSFVDTALNLVTSLVSIVRRTLVVEGNR